MIRMSHPRSAAASATSSGNAPPPAMMAKRPFEAVDNSALVSVARRTDGPVAAFADEIKDFMDNWMRCKLTGNVFYPFLERAFIRKQQAVGAPDVMDDFTGKPRRFKPTILSPARWARLPIAMP